MFSRLILLLLLLLTNCAWAANGIALIDDTHHGANVLNSAQYYIDDTKQLSIDTISSEEYAKHFLPVNKKFLQLGLVSGNIWLRADIAIRTTKDTPVLLEVNAPRLEYLDIFIPSLYENQDQAQLGNARPYANRLVDSPNYLYPLPTNAPPVFTLYLKLSSHLPINAQINLKSLSKASLDAQKSFSFTGVLLGGLLILFLSNIFFYLKSAHVMYILYGALLVCVALFHLALHGQLYQFFPTQVGLEERIYNFSALTCLVMIIFFSRLYLDTKTFFPSLDKVLILVGTSDAFFAVLFAVSPHFVSIVYLSGIAFLSLCILTILAVLAYSKSIPLSGFYLTARMASLIGYFAWSMAAYGIIPEPTIYAWGLTIAFIIEAMIHFAGMTTQLNPLLKNPSRVVGYSQAEMFDLLSDLSSRMRRQINVLDGGLQQLEQNVKNEKSKSLINNGLAANHNLQELSERLDFISTAKDPQATNMEQSIPIFLTKILDDAYNHFQKLDQDDANIDVVTENIEDVEILYNAETIQHLIETLLQECKFFTDQTLTLTVSRQELNREGISTLTINCQPLPSRITIEEESFDLGTHYILRLVRHLNGKIHFSSHDNMRTMNISIPVFSHIRHASSDSEQVAFYDLILFGQHDKDLQQALNVLQSQPNSIEHVTQIDELISLLETPHNRENGSIIVVFDNGGNIPHVTHQKIRPLMKEEDQCLLITNNVKMSRDYAKTIGFDELLTCNEIENQFLLQLSRLIRKGERLKKVSLSRVKHLHKAP